MRVALPKGRLLDGVLGVLAEIGLRFERDGDRDYRPRASEPGLEAKLVKASGD